MAWLSRKKVKVPDRHAVSRDGTEKPVPQFVEPKPRRHGLRFDPDFRPDRVGEPREIFQNLTDAVEVLQRNARREVGRGVLHQIPDPRLYPGKPLRQIIEFSGQKIEHFRRDGMRFLW